MAKILIVEDNEMNRDMLSRRLARRGYAVLTAVDGEQGLVTAEAERPDLILMDMSLPVMDGWEATRRLKADDQTKTIPVLAVTGHALTGVSNDAKNAGCDGFITKPCLPEDLVAEIRKVLGGTRSGQQHAKVKA